MNKIVMRNKEYKIVSNENQYDLEVNGSVLYLKRGEETYMTIDLEKVCLGTKLAILESVGVVLEETVPKNKSLFDIWLEKNPGKDWEAFLEDCKKTTWRHSEITSFTFLRETRDCSIYGVVAEGITIGELVVPKKPININQEEVSGMKTITKHHPFSLWLRDPNGKLVLEAQGNKEDLLIIVESFKDKYFNYAIETF